MVSSDSTLFFLMKWLLMKWVCQECDLKEIQQEWQTPGSYLYLLQDLSLET